MFQVLPLLLFDFLHQHRMNHVETQLIHPTGDDTPKGGREPAWSTPIRQYISSVICVVYVFGIREIGRF
jgi:hypothetical protein